MAGSEVAGFALYSMAGVAFSIDYTAWVLRLAGVSLATIVRATWQRCVLPTLGVVALLSARLVVPTWALVAMTASVTLAVAWVAFRAFRRDTE